MNTASRRVFKAFDFFLVFSMLLSMLGSPLAVSAAGGSYSLDWAAADPQVNKAPYLPTYSKVPPSAMGCPTPSGSSGRAANPMQHAIFGSPKDAVESLAPPEMALGQIVPFELQVTVSGSTAPENGVIQFSSYWLTKTTSGDNFGYDPAYEVYCAFVDTADAATIDPGANAKVDSWTDTVVNPGTSNEQIQGTFQLSGLDNGDSVIVEIWVVLKNTIPPGSSGNVQTGLLSAKTAAGDTINTGNQTVPLLRVQEFFSSDADVSVTKSDSPDPLVGGSTLTYSLVVTNNALVNIANGVIVTDTLDPNTSFVSASGASCTAASGIVTCNVGALAPLQSVTITIVTTVSSSAPVNVTGGDVPATGTCTAGSADLCNRVSVTAINDDPKTDNNSDSEPTNVLPPPPTFNVTKTANPTEIAEPGGSVAFTVQVDNTGTVPFTLSSLNDSMYGNLDGVGTCDVPQAIAVSGSYSCTFTQTISGNAGSTHTNVVTATVGTLTDTDDATVTITNVPPTVDLTKVADPLSLPEPGGDFTFKLTIKNTSAEAVTITALTDSNPLSPECSALVGTILAAGETKSCTYTVNQTAVGSYANTASVTVTDDDNSTASDTAEATVAVTAVGRSIVVTKTAAPTELAEPGGDVTYTVEVLNSSVIAVTLDSLVDNIFGDLNGVGTCATGASIAPNNTYSCSFTQTISGNAGTSHTDVVTAWADGAMDTDDATVTFTDVAPGVDLTKLADPLSLPEPGGDFTFKLTIKNTSAEAVTITALTDTNPLSPECSALVGTSLAAGETKSCTYTVNHTAVDTYVNTASVTVTDDDNSTASDTAEATVTVTNVAPTVTLNKSASPATLPEPGGDFTYTLTITNTSNEMVTITELNDLNYLSLPEECTGLVGTTLAAQASTFCTFTVPHQEPGVYPNTATVTVTDAQGTTASATDTESVEVTNVAPVITVAKTANPTSIDEPGGMVTFTVEVTNDTFESITLTSLTDDVYGNLNGQGSCAIGGQIAPGASYTCSFQGAVSGEPGFYTDIVTAVAADNDGSTGTDTDDATVEITGKAPTITVDKTADPISLPEPGGMVTFTVVVTNTSFEAVTLTSLTDDVYGDLNGQGDCATGGLIAAGGSYTCSFSGAVSGQPGYYTDTVTATVTDNDEATGTDYDDAIVMLTDVMPDISITKTAAPTHVPETGGDVTFTFLVQNIGLEDVTLTSLIDSQFGDLDGQGDCAVPQAISVGGSYSCSITMFLSSDSLTEHTNVVTAVGTDDDGSIDTATDDETVNFDDVKPDILITKTANPTSVPETGGDVTFTFLVQNIGLEDVTLTSLNDSKFGDLNGQGNCVTGGLIPVGGSYSCAITVNLSSDSLANHTNLVTAVGTDDDGSADTATDDETVSFEDVAPAIMITKTASPTHVPETGGEVTFTFLVENIGQEDVTLTNLQDTVFGDLNGQGDCAVPQTIAIGSSYTCSVTRFLSSDSLTAHTNVSTATVVDDDDTPATDDDDETVTFDDVAPLVRITKSANPASVPETGGSVTFTFLVENIGQEDFTLTKLEDTVFGDLNGQGDCTVPQTILIDGSYSCSITVNLASDDLVSHTNVSTVTVVDDDNTSGTDDDDETVTFTDVLPDISVTKTANLTSVPETGGNVIFTFVVKNNGLESATISSLEDTLYGILTGDADCAVGTVLSAGASCEFSITRWVEGDFSGPDHVNTFTGKATDNDGNEDTATDDETVDFTNVLPAIEVTKTASPSSIPETGGDVTFTFVVKNTSTEEQVTITSLEDTVYGTLAGDADCKLGTVLAAGASCEFSLTNWVEGDFSGPDHFNQFTAIATDNDATEATDSDDETVVFEDVLPTISVTKLADQKQVFDPGEDVTFTFTVKNDGLETVTISGLSDTVFGTLAGDDDCKVGTSLAAGASCTFSISGLISSDHSNTFTAEAQDNDGNSGSADATASVDVINPSIAIVKMTVDGTTVGDGLDILTGETIGWRYIVTNDGDVTLSGISVTDNMGVTVTCPKTTLAAGESMTCTAAGKAKTGSYSNIGTVSGSHTDQDGDTANRSASDGSSYFGALPQISITKTTTDGYNQGDGFGILPGGTVTWNYVVENIGNVALSSIVVTDDQNVSVTCPETTLAVGESMTCTATGTAVPGWYNNIGLASGSFTDSGGHTLTDTDYDPSSYYGLTPGQITNSSLCDFGETFRLVFTPDMQRYTSATPYYKLSDSNPGQFFYNLFAVNDGTTDTYTLAIPYPFVTQGAMPVHVYGGVSLDQNNPTTCFLPQNTLASYGSIITLSSYTDTNGDGKVGYGDVVEVDVPSEPGFQYINIHLDYGLEKTRGWIKKGTNVTGDGAVEPSVAGVTIADHSAHLFQAYADGVIITGTTDTIYNQNEFKQIRGFGGLVYKQVGLDEDNLPVYEAYLGAHIELRKVGSTTVLETMVTDSDGWYLSSKYVHKGKAAQYTMTLVAENGYPSQTVTVTMGGNLKYGEGNFFIPPMP